MIDRLQRDIAILRSRLDLIDSGTLSPGPVSMDGGFVTWARNVITLVERETFTLNELQYIFAALLAYPYSFDWDDSDELKTKVHRMLRMRAEDAL